MSEIRANSITDADGTGAPNFPNGLSVADGSAAAPSITNTGDTNTGIYFPAADTVSISTAGSEGLRVTPGGQTYVNGALGLGGPNYGNPSDIMLSNGSGSPGIWLAASSVVASYVGTATAGLAYGAVGTYAFLVFRGGGFAANATIAGSSLIPGGAYANTVVADNSVGAANGSAIATGSGALAGTWRAMGAVTFSSGSSFTRGAVFLRIS